MALCLAACGSGGSSTTGPSATCDGTCTQRALAAADVRDVVGRAVAEAERLGVAVTVAVVDRVGNVLAVFQMDGAAANTVITSQRDVSTGLETLVVPTTLAAISKAGTAAYLSSQGNAFTTRTASQIVQEHFNPGESGRPGGPLFGVQFSQLPCGDVVTRFDDDCADDRTGPHRLPLGLSADPGGIPLYMDSTGPAGMSGRVPVGGVGIELGCGALTCDALTAAAGSDAVVGLGVSVCPSFEACRDTPESLYTVDPVILDVDENIEERIASAAAASREAPASRRADRIFVDGKSLRFADDEDHGGVPGQACADLDGVFVAVGGFTNVRSCAEVGAGVAIGTIASGVRSVAAFGDSGLAAEILVDAAGAPRYAATSTPNPGSLTAVEVQTLLEHALSVADSLRAAIRNPLDTPARVTISVVDVAGNVQGIVRSPDAPVFGIDVSVQKARAVALLSAPDAADLLSRFGGRRYYDATVDFLTGRATFGDENIDAGDVLTGGIAFTARAIGNLARPFFPDGIDRRDNGPLSLPLEQWSPFSTGLQLQLVVTGIAGALANAGSEPSCMEPQPLPECSNRIPQARNGIQIFPGAVPIYRGNVLVGAIGISGDGIDQDDAIAFLGLHRASLELGTIDHAPQPMRADRIEVEGSNLRYVSCPVRPFRGSDEMSPCDGK
ncbi:MAG TPA: heme-binding protein [Candidatus Binatia bacterium]|nr:heme-binding protein [Candidatus Binatia bacterium]